MDLYGKDEPCMSYTNDEIKEHLIEPLSERPGFDLRMRAEHGVELADPSDGQIVSIDFDGETENFTILFYGYRTSIFISDEDKTVPRPRFSHREEFVPNWTFNEEFLFLGEDVRQSYYKSPETYGNVVYGGPLRSKTHEEQLALLREFVILLGGAKSMRIERLPVSQEEKERYLENRYTVHIRKDSAPPRRAEYDNILLLINCEELPC